MLQFDERTLRLINRSYAGSDIVRRRRASFDALDLRPGDRVLDLGAGQGLLTAEIARAVGDEGGVFALDPSEDMLAAAAAQCAEFGNVEVRQGSASQLPAEDESFDKAVSLQVFEYVEDQPAALNELHRVLKPGGLAVIGNNHWDTLVWRSDAPDRMARMTAAWARHVTETRAPALLPERMRAVGFAFREIVAVPFVDVHLRPDGLANMLLHLAAAYAVQNDLLGEEEVTAWADEQRALAAAGRFFFSLTHFVVIGARQ